MGCMAQREVSDSGAAQATDAEQVYTYHWEPVAQGGERYVRCERCGREVIPADADRLLHKRSCPEADR